ncbi:hypothetical protein [Rubritalea tangerina]|uniref:hypothetical protein n=1 Tax=Rubritalea tangerina TaxID=430798 RepID=UPI00361C4B42
MEPIDDSFKEMISSSLVTFTYQNREILALRASRLEQPQMYNGEYYSRHLSHSKKVEKENYYSFFKNFSS